MWLMNGRISGGYLHIRWIVLLLSTFPRRGSESGEMHSNHARRASQQYMIRCDIEMTSAS